MYKALIVDDEVWVRKGIIQKLKTGGFSFDWIGEASDGEEAMEIIAAEHPHLVITDIRMNEMDGIELIRNTVERFSDTKFVIISGYGEFDYAEQAINMGVAGYILKPIKDEQFVKTINRVLKELDYRQEMAGLSSRNEMLEKDSSSIKLQQEVFRLLNFHGEAVNNELAAGSPFAPGTAFILAILNIDSSSYTMSGFKYQDAGLAKFAVKNILLELWEEQDVFIMDNPRDGNQILVLFHGEREEGFKAKCDRLLVDAYSRISGLLQIDMTIAVSSECGSICSKLYSQAWEAFELRLVYGGNRLFRFDSIKADGRFHIPEQKLKLVQNYLELRDFKNLEVILNDMFSSKSMGASASQYIRYLHTEIVNILIKVGIKLGADVTGRMDSNALSGDLAGQFASTQEIISYIIAMAMKVLKPDPYAYTDKKSLIAKVREYIESNYHTDFSINDLSRVFAINPDYLSTLYSQETGKTLIRHLTEIRIQNACRLLRESGYSTVDISRSVGYSEPQYFYKVFKKITGMTPLEYKKDV